jgi:hypothetical protein
MKTSQIFTVTLTIPADTPDDAIRGLRRLVRELPKDELAERCQVEEIIGDPTLDEGMTVRQVRQVRKLLRTRWA